MNLFLPLFLFLSLNSYTHSPVHHCWQRGSRGVSYWYRYTRAAYACATMYGACTLSGPYGLYLFFHWYLFSSFPCSVHHSPHVQLIRSIWRYCTRCRPLHMLLGWRPSLLAKFKSLLSISGALYIYLYSEIFCVGLVLHFNTCAWQS